MVNPIPALCPVCGAALPANDPSGLCVGCVFRDMANPMDFSDLDTESSEPNGSREFGDFELLSEIARGGAGVVYRARDVRLNRIVALKVLVAGEFAAPEFLSRFRTEAEAAALLDHPNIVPIYEVGGHDHRPFLSMKLIVGGTLAASAPSGPEAAARLMSTLSRAVHYAHQRGILHRDIKPTNVLVDADGVPYLTDFGLARVLQHDSHLTRTAAVLGTPSFMAPEQAAGNSRELTTAADIWGLGAVLYHLLTGHPPFAGATAVETLRRVVEKPPAAPRSLNPGVPPDLEVICLKCLEKNPRDRYASAEALAEDLDRWLAHEPIHARPATATEWVVKWCQRNPVLAVLLVLLLVVTGVGAAGLLWQSRKTQRALRDAHRALYAAEMSLVKQAWHEGNVARVRALLDLLVPAPGMEELRGFEWRYFHGLATGRDTDRIPTGDNVQSVAVSPDRSTLALGSGNGAIWLMDVASRQVRTTLTNAAAPGARAVAFSPDGRYLAVATTTPTLRVWDLTTRETFAEVRLGTDWLERVSFSADGRFLAAASRPDGVIGLWHFPSLIPIDVLAPGPNQRPSLAFTRSGDEVVFADGEGVLFVHPLAPGGKSRRVVRTGSTVVNVLGTPDGTGVVTTATDGSVKVWSLADGSELRRFVGHPTWVTSAAYSADGNRLATASTDGTLRVWDALTGLELARLLGHTAWVNDVRFLDADTVVSGADDGDLRLWPWESFRNQHEVAEYRLPSGELPVNRPWPAIAIGPDSRFLVLSRQAGSAVLWDWTKGAAVDRFQADSLPLHAIAYSPDGHWLASGGEGTTVRLWRMTDGKPVAHAVQLPVSQEKAMVLRLRFATDGTSLAMADRYAIQIWSVPDGQLRQSMVLSPREHHLSAVEFTPDLKSAFVTSSGLRRGVIEARRLSSPQWRQDLVGHENIVVDLALSPDAGWLASASLDGTLRLWDARRLSPVAVLRGHSGAVTAVDFAPDGRTLASAGADGTVRLWSVPARREVAVMPGAVAPLTRVRFTPDGRHLLAFAAADLMRVWSTPPY